MLIEMLAMLVIVVQYICNRKMLGLIVKATIEV